MTTTEPNAEHSGAGAPQIADRHLRSELWLPTLLSVIAGMVDVIGFLSFGPFTAHVTGNIVVIGAPMVRHNRVNPSRILAIRVFILTVAATWLIAKASGRRGAGLMRPLLLIQFVLISCLCSWRKSRSRQLTFGFIIPPCT